MESAFLTDAMLGRLAKWLRVLGYDTHYRRRYTEGSIVELLEQGRLLLSRNQGTIRLHPGSMLICSERVGAQVQEMRNARLIDSEPEKWFTRCLICNVPLEKPDTRDALPDVPEYVFYRQGEEISRCPSCGRHFWPGTHRERMIGQLRQWGF
jgi:uncharacterized protein